MNVLYFPSITELMNISLEEIIRKFKVSPKELREIADKIEKETPEDERKEEERMIKLYYDKIMKLKRKKP